MSYKPNFKIKHHDRLDSNKDTYDRMSKEKRNLRKDEPFVLMFRNFIFFDVKSYECRNGDLYIRNIVDGIILKRYFRMDGDDQLTVFKNREEFDAFIKNVEEKGYRLGPDKHIEFEKGRNWYRGYIERKAEREYYNKRELVDKVLQDNEQEDSEPDIHGLLKQASDNFVLENFTASRNSETGKIDVVTSTWDGYSMTRDECPEAIDDVVRVLEAKPGSAQILTKNDFMWRG